MVSRALRTFSFTAIAVFLSAATFAAKDPASYQIGDRAEEDIVAPVALTVIDDAATRTLKQREAERIPVHMRFYTNSAAETEAGFRATFAATQSAFLSALEVAFQTRKLAEPDLNSSRFTEFVIYFQRQNPLLPVTGSLARKWAAGDSADAVEDALAEKLRAAMRRPVREAESPPADLKIGSTARLIPLAGTNETATTQVAAQRGVNVPKADLISIQRTRTELQDSFAPEDRPLARYVISLITPNCIVETNLTRELRAARTAGLTVADHYAAGQTVVRRGQLIDAKIRAALDQVKEKTAVSQLQQIVATTQVKTAQSRQRTWWLIGSFSALVLVLVAAVWRLSRRRAANSLLPVPVSGGSPFDPADASWRQRALVAEDRAQKAQAAVRAGVMAHLARWMSDTFTRRLISQRSQMLDERQKATAEMEKFGERLETIHSRLQDRLIAYERRIAELEKELETKGEQNRELIKAEIQAMKQQLEAERKKSRLEYN